MEGKKDTEKWLINKVAQPLNLFHMHELGVVRIHYQKVQRGQVQSRVDFFGQTQRRKTLN
jgi:hypothetical protein